MHVLLISFSKSEVQSYKLIDKVFPCIFEKILGASTEDGNLTKLHHL